MMILQMIVTKDALLETTITNLMTARNVKKLDEASILLIYRINIKNVCYA